MRQACGTITIAASGIVKESSGTSVSDSTSNANTGALLNGASITSSGKIGNANSFDGINDVMNAGSSASLDNLIAQGNGGMTVSAWVNPVNDGYWAEVANKAQDAGPANGWLLEVNNQYDKFTFGHTGTGGAGIVSKDIDPITYNSWSYFGATYNGGTSGAAIQTIL